jgi:hypothetical protein
LAGRIEENHENSARIGGLQADMWTKDNLNTPGSVVGIATANGLDGPGIESR